MSAYSAADCAATSAPARAGAVIRRSSRWAACSSTAAGASPISRSRVLPTRCSTTSMRPTPCAPAMTSRAGDQLEERHRDAVDRGRHAALELRSRRRPARPDTPGPASSACRFPPAARRRACRIRSTGPRGSAPSDRDRDRGGQRHAARARVVGNLRRGSSPQSRAGASTFDRRVERADRRVEPRGAPAPAPPCATVGRLLDVGDLDELLRDQRTGERRRHRRAIVEDRVGLQRAAAM